MHSHSLSSKTLNELIAVVEQYGLTILAMHPGTQDAELMKYFFVEVETQNDVDHITKAFLRCTAVEGAYSKAEGEPP
ncbi:MAG: hypothetical protein ACC707_13155 [Thiohalomonadales bacterium]